MSAPRVAALDGLRGLAASSVVLAHAVAALAKPIAKLSEPRDIPQARGGGRLDLDRDHITARVLDDQVNLMATPIAIVVEAQQRAK